jgi:hypothetical protein
MIVELTQVPWSFSDREETQGTVVPQAALPGRRPFVVFHPDLATRDGKFLKTAPIATSLLSKPFHLHLLSLLIVLSFVLLLPQSQSTSCRNPTTNLLSYPIL